VSGMNLSTAMRGTLVAIYERLTTGQDTWIGGYLSGGGNSRTLDALESRGLLTWGTELDPWKRWITLTAAGLAEAADYSRCCPRCRAWVRAERRPVTVGWGPSGTRNIGDAIKGPCPCRWHDDEGIAL
jgi:hypothetical protein